MIDQLGIEKIAGADVPRYLESPQIIDLPAGVTGAIDIAGLLGPGPFKLRGSYAAATPTTGVASGVAGTSTTTTSVVKPAAADNWTADDFNGKYVRVSSYDTVTLSESGAGSVAITADSPGASGITARVVVRTALRVVYLDFKKQLLIELPAAGDSDDDIAAAINACADCQGLLTAVSGSAGDITEAIAATALTGGSVAERAISDTATGTITLASAASNLAAGSYFEVLDLEVTVLVLTAKDCLCPITLEAVQVASLDADRLAKLRLDGSTVITATVDDCAVVELSECGQIAATPLAVDFKACGHVTIDDCALTGALIRTIDCQVFDGDGAIAKPRLDALVEGLTADGGDLVIVGTGLTSQVTFDSAVLTLGDDAGTVTVTAVKPGDSGLTIEIEASDTGTTLAVTLTDGAIVVALDEAGNSAAEIAALIIADAEETDGYVRATASGSGDTTSAVAETALSGGTGTYADTKVVVGGVEALPANAVDGAATWAATEITATVGADHAADEIVEVHVEVDGVKSNSLSYLVGAGA